MRALLLVLCASCAHAAAPAASASPSSSESSDEDLETKMADLDRAIGALERGLTAAQGACPEIAAAVRKFASREANAAADVAAFLVKLDPTDRDKFHKRHLADADRLQVVYERATNWCPGDGEVGAAIDVAHLRPASPDDDDPDVHLDR